jgi:hypothetical protein
MVPGGDPRMEWTLCLVGAGIDGQSRSVDVMTISRPDGLGEIANGSVKNLGQVAVCKAISLIAA